MDVPAAKPDATEQRLADLRTELDAQMRTFIGYPCAGDFNYDALQPFFRYPLNNVGDPFSDGSYRVDTRLIEREVLAWFAALNHASEDEYWGYVTTGGTEGNMYGMYVARELLPDGIVYYSEATHYSAIKIMRVLGLRHITIRAQTSGAIDCDDLYETLRIHRDAPPIIFANVGTTMTEGIDDVVRIKAMLSDLATDRSYVHVDAAFSGMTLPFCKDPPAYDFRCGIDSIAISGHKFIGMPFPCGIVLAQHHHADRIARSIEYVGTRDTTLTGSRSGLAPLFLWYAIQRWGSAGFRRRVAQGQNMARYAVERFLDGGIHAWRNPLSLTAVFPTPPAELQEKWQLAVQGNVAHIMTVPPVNAERVDAFINDYLAACP